MQNELLPASDRIPPHTRKKPSGPFDRSRLLQHLKTQAVESTVGDDYVPFVKKTPKEPPAAKVHVYTVLVQCMHFWRAGAIQLMIAAGSVLVQRLCSIARQIMFIRECTYVCAE